MLCFVEAIADEAVSGKHKDGVADLPGPTLLHKWTCKWVALFVTHHNRYANAVDDSVLDALHME